MRYLVVAAFLMICQQTNAVDWLDSEVIGKLFADAGVQGTFVLYDVDAKHLIGHDRVRAETRFVPGSTFKIANSLLGLSLGAVKGVDEVLPYGGQPQPFKVWEHDMGLREAIKVSNVPIYQELARRIGLKRMRAGVIELDYGNGEIGDVVDQFWLRGPLKISAVEQTTFLARLVQDALPFPKDVQEQVRDIMLLEQGDDWRLYGKTGWVNAANPGIGWWVGWVLKRGHVYSFALNIDIGQQDALLKRIELGKTSLKALGVLD